jgi:hypothetical protein
MKKIFFTLALIMGSFLYLQAGVITVSNNVNSPGQYTNLQTAIDSASVGDTILVSGSPTNYGNITINKRLTLFGSGYNPNNTFAGVAYLAYVYLQRFDAIQSASGTKISGFDLDYIYSYDHLTDTMRNITIERCLISGSLLFTYNGTLARNKNFTVQNCVFTSASSNINFGLYYQTTFTDCVFRNNIFNGIISGDIANVTTFNNLSSVYFRNNIFTNSGTGTQFNELKNMVLENNIFFRRDAGNDDSFSPSAHCNGCAFNNNITYLTANDNIPYGNNVGSGNLIATDPMLVNYPVTGAAFSYAHDYTLLAGSPAINAGTDGTDIGITGGAVPFEVGAPPRIPQMTSVVVGPPSSVPLNGTLQIQFSAQKQD